MNNRLASLTRNIIINNTSYTGSEIDNMSAFERITITSAIMQACEDTTNPFVAKLMGIK